MAGVNKWIGVGNLGRDAELRYTPGGAAVSSFSIACSESWTDKSGQRQERTEWVTVVLWGKPAESLQEYLVKGKQVYVEGKLQTREYDGKDGTKKKAVEVRADRLVLLGGSGGKSAGGGAARTRQDRAAAEDEPVTTLDDDEDLPF